MGWGEGGEGWRKKGEAEQNEKGKQRCGLRSKQKKCRRFRGSSRCRLRRVCVCVGGNIKVNVEIFHPLAH